MPLYTHKDLHWFHLANAASGYWLKQNFYSFKKRFLAQHAYPAGYDLQIIYRECWSCNGTGTFSINEECRKCAGTGLYGPPKEIILRRFALAGRIYHVPTDPTDPGEPEPGDVPIQEQITGLVKHAPVSADAGRRAYFRLLLRHEPRRFHDLALQWLTRRKGSNRWLFRLIRTRNKQDLFPAISHESFAPFAPFA